MLAIGRLFSQTFNPGKTTLISNQVNLTQLAPACPELCTAQPQLVLTIFHMTFLNCLQKHNYIFPCWLKKSKKADYEVYFLTNLHNLYKLYRFVSKVKGDKKIRYMFADIMILALISGEKRIDEILTRFHMQCQWVGQIC